MMTFYTGPEHKEIERMFMCLKRYFILEENVDSSNAAAYRHMVKKMYYALPVKYKRKSDRDKDLELVKDAIEDFEKEKGVET